MGHSSSPVPGAVSRRQILRASAQSVAALGLVVVGDWLSPALARASRAGADAFGALLPPDANGLRLPAGFSSRVVAVTGRAVGTTSYAWPANPDGGATFPTRDGGWVYVSNHESNWGAGGVSAIRFSADASIADAYSILRGSNRNCAGGPTPWGTWLSCEEREDGRVFECDPHTPGSQGTVVAGLGTFNHEAAAVDPRGKCVYLTEDKSDGLLYRFAPSRYPDLRNGSLEAAQILDPKARGPIRPGEKRPLAWHPIAQANPSGGGVQSASHLPTQERATRFQAAGSSAFDGGEGCWFHGGRVYFSTKGDDRVWVVDTKSDEIQIVYDRGTYRRTYRSTSSTPELSDVDNVFAAPSGDVYIAEDPGNLRIAALTPSGKVVPVVQLTGQLGTEITGPALSPDGSRLYFSSQRNPGTTYEVTGPFLAAR